MSAKKFALLNLDLIFVTRQQKLLHKKAFGDQTMGKRQLKERFNRFKTNRKSVECGGDHHRHTRRQQKHEKMLD